MHIDIIRSRVHATPFHPFALQLSSGVRYPVPHPEFISFTDEVVVVIEPPYSVRIVDMAHIAALEDMGARTGA